MKKQRYSSESYAYSFIMNTRVAELMFHLFVFLTLEESRREIMGDGRTCSCFLSLLEN